MTSSKSRQLMICLIYSRVQTLSITELTSSSNAGLTTPSILTSDGTEMENSYMKPEFPPRIWDSNPSSSATTECTLARHQMVMGNTSWRVKGEIWPQLAVINCANVPVHQALTRWLTLQRNNYRRRSKRLKRPWP